MMRSGEISTKLSSLEALLDQIEEWRRMRPRPRAMPEPLWGEAAALARELGVYRVARALRLNFDTLRRRAKHSSTAAAQRRIVAHGHGFVEVTGFAELARAGLVGETVVEVVGSDGARLSIRMPCTSADVVAWIGAFRGRP